MSNSSRYSSELRCPECGSAIDAETIEAMREKWRREGGPAWRREQSARLSGLLDGAVIGAAIAGIAFGLWKLFA